MSKTHRYYLCTPYISYLYENVGMSSFITSMNISAIDSMGWDLGMGYWVYCLGCILDLIGTIMVQMWNPQTKTVYNFIVSFYTGSERHAKRSLATANGYGSGRETSLVFWLHVLLNNFSHQNIQK